MTPAESLASHRTFMAEIGETVMVRRFSGTGPTRPFVDTPTTARVMGYQPRDLVGTITQGDRKVIALVDTLGALLPLLPNNDQLVIRGKPVTIKAVDDNTRRIQGVLIALELQVSG